MSERASLETILTSLPDSVEWPPDCEDMPGRVVATLESKPDRHRRLRWPVAASLALAAALTVGLVPTARQVVADMLFEAGVRIGFTQESSTVSGSLLGLGEQFDLDEAADRVQFSVRVPLAALGSPDVVYVDSTERLSMVWRDYPGAEIAEGDGTVLLTEKASDSLYAQKSLDPETDITRVMIEDGPGFWIEGDHTFILLDEEGHERTETTHLSANALLWNHDGVAMRLELLAGLQRALNIVESLEER